MIYMFSTKPHTLSRLARTQQFRQIKGCACGTLEGYQCRCLAVVREREREREREGERERERERKRERELSSDLTLDRAAENICLCKQFPFLVPVLVFPR